MKVPSNIHRRRTPASKHILRKYRNFQNVFEACRERLYSYRLIQYIVSLHKSATPSNIEKYAYYLQCTTYTLCLNILISTCTTLYHYKLFLLLFENVLECRPLIDCRGDAQELTGGFRYDFTETQAASCVFFQCQNRRFRVFEAAY